MPQSTQTKPAKAKRSWSRTPPPDHTPSTSEWVDIAREVLITEGIVEVKIDRLAKRAGVTRGGFYWRFKNRDELLDILLEDWKARNTGPIIAALRGPGSALDRLERLARLYIDERDFSSDYDAAVRLWAGLSPTVAAQVRDVDEMRIDALRAVFTDAGFEEEEALIRARITYFHQVGYYAIGMREPRERREALSSIYLKILTGIARDA